MPPLAPGQGHGDGLDAPVQDTPTALPRGPGVPSRHCPVPVVCAPQPIPTPSLLSPWSPLVCRCDIVWRLHDKSPLGVWGGPPIKQPDLCQCHVLSGCQRQTSLLGAQRDVDRGTGSSRGAARPPCAPRCATQPRPAARATKSQTQPPAPAAARALPLAAPAAPIFRGNS